MRAPRAARRGFVVVLVICVIVIIAMIAGGLYLRFERVNASVLREQNGVASRLLADSGLDLVRHLAASGTLPATDLVDLPSGRVGYAVDAERQDGQGRRCRDAVVFGLAGRSRRVVVFRLILDAPTGGSGPAVDAELPTDVSSANLGPVPPPSGGAAALVAKAVAAAQTMAP